MTLVEDKNPQTLTQIGSVSLSSGSATVTGSSFLATVLPGQSIQFSSQPGRAYTVASVQNDTLLTLSEPFTGPSGGANASGSSSRATVRPVRIPFEEVLKDVDPNSLVDEQEALRAAYDAIPTLPSPLDPRKAANVAQLKDRIRTTIGKAEGGVTMAIEALKDVAPLMKRLGEEIAVIDARTDEDLRIHNELVLRDDTDRLRLRDSDDGLRAERIRLEALSLGRDPGRDPRDMGRSPLEPRDPRDPVRGPISGPSSVASRDPRDPLGRDPRNLGRDLRGEAGK